LSIVEVACFRTGERHGRIQEIIVQNFRAKPNTKMARALEPDLNDLLWTIPVARLIFGAGLEKAHLMGWAMGNRISCATATYFPDRVATVTLLAAGGLVPATAAPGELNRLLSDANLPEEEKLQLARRTLFSPATEDAKVREFVAELRYWPEGRNAQTSANRATPETEWWSGGVAPMLIIQGLDDTTAPVGNGRQMKETEGERMLTTAWRVFCSSLCHFILFCVPVG